VDRPAARDGYAEASRRPLEILFFLLPLLALFEVGVALAVRRGDGGVAVLAQESLAHLLRAAGVRAENLGLPALSLPAIGIVLTLLVWQVIGRFPWTVRLPVVGGMHLESLAMAVPLVAINALATGRVSADASTLGALADQGALTRASAAIGAGVYEELVFRMGIMGALHMLLADVAGWKEPRAWISAVVASAAVFSWAHAWTPGQAPTGAWAYGFLALAGAWWGWLYHWRGFGVAVGAHIAYDLTVLLPRA
jgi:hypothetical protein